MKSTILPPSCLYSTVQEMRARRALTEARAAIQSSDKKMRETLAKLEAKKLLHGVKK